MNLIEFTFENADGRFGDLLVNLLSLLLSAYAAYRFARRQARVQSRERRVEHGRMALFALGRLFNRMLQFRNRLLTLIANTAFFFSWRYRSTPWREERIRLGIPTYRS